MTQWILSFFLFFSIILLIHIFKLLEKTNSVLKISNQSFDVVRSDKQTEDEKEKQLQKNAIKLFRLFFVLSFLGAVSFLFPLGIVKLICIITNIPISSIYKVTFSPLFITIAVILSVVIFIFSKKQKTDSNQYSFNERFLHYIAFNTYPLQIPVSEMISQFYSKNFNKINTDHPVFITGLPRSGTTLLLECSAKLSDLATHSYRDMPFVLIPYIWSKFTSKFQESGALRERAHGDGMLINFDSPEAFEEIIWKTFWKKNYKKQFITPWKPEGDELFLEFFQDHMRKIVHLRSDSEASKLRYVSKNNMNIARIEFLNKNFPKSVIIIPFRDPLQHAKSSLKQHLNFLSIHKEDRFAAQYMKAIGHFDFGENLRPINFNNWFLNRQFESSKELGFWLEYWIASYSHLSQLNFNNVYFVDYDKLCESPQKGLGLLGEIINTNDMATLQTCVETIHSSKKRDIDTSKIPAEMIKSVNVLHAKLKNLAVN